MISKENYEAYFLDYIEGNLSPKDIDMLLLFLDKNTSLKEELSNYSEISLKASNTNFNKEGLLQVDLIEDEITTSNIETFAIANLENILPTQKSNELNLLINSNPEFSKKVRLVNNTILEADKSIVFADKEDLKKTIPLFIPYYRIAGIAAILLLMIYFYIPNKKFIDNENQLAKTNNSSLNSELQIPLNNSELSNKIFSEQKENKSKFVNNHKKSINNLLSNSNINRIDEELTKVIPNPVFEIKKMNNHEISQIAPTKSERILTNTPLVSITNYYEKSSTITLTDNNKFLSPKEFLASVFKKKILNSDSDGSELKAEDFNSALASTTNNKISFKKGVNNDRLLSIQTRNFSFEKKLKNKEY